MAKLLGGIVGVPCSGLSCPQSTVPEDDAAHVSPFTVSSCRERSFALRQKKLPGGAGLGPRRSEFAAGTQGSNGPHFGFGSGSAWWDVVVDECGLLW